MAKEQKKQTISSVSDILGFVLEQSEKPPDKRRPVDAQTAGFQTDSEYMSTLVDALALPGTFVGEEFLKTMESMVNPTFEIKTYRDRIGTTKIRATDLPAFFENPDEFVDKFFEKNKNISKLSKLQWAGEQMKMLAGSSYAKKMKLFDSYSPEMKDILERALGQTAMKSKQETDMTWMAQASEKIYNEGYLSKELKRLESEIGKATNPHTRERLKEEINEINKLYKSSYTVNLKTKKVEINNAFQRLLQEEFKAFGNNILKGRKVEDLSKKEFEEYSKAIQANNTVNLWTSYQGLPRDRRQFKKAFQNLRKNKTLLNQQKNAVRSGGKFTINGKEIDYGLYSSKQIKSELKNINQRIRGVNSARSSLNSVRLWGTIGDLEGKYYGIQSTLGPGGVEAFLNGDFFDYKKGYWGCPTTEGKINIKGTDKTLEFYKAGYKEGKHLTNNYNEAMTNLYYYTPAGIFKSLITGERFAWRADKKEQQIIKMFGIKGKSGVLAGVLKPEFWDFFSKYKNANPVEQAKLLSENAEYSMLLGKVLSGMKNSKIAKKFLKAEKLAKQFKMFSKLGYAFNTPQRLLKELQDKTIGALQGKIRKGIGSLLMKLKMFSENEGVKSMLNSWIAKGGGKALTAAISNAIVGVLGLAGTAVAGPLGLAISFAISAILEKIGKVSIKVFIFALAGVVGIFFIIGSLGTQKNQNRTDAYSREVPGEIGYNDEFTSYGGGEEGGNDDDDIPVGPKIIPPPSGEECIFGSSSIGCSQGWGGPPCFSHGSILNLKPVDLTSVGWIYAPQFCDNSGAECVIQNAASFYCIGNTPGGGQVWFSAFDGNTTYKFHFVHTVLGGTYSPGSKVRAGEAFAFVQQDLTKNSCWSGPHLHLETQQNGEYVDPLALLQSFNCNVPSLSGCTNCIGGN